VLGVDGILTDWKDRSLNATYGPLKFMRRAARGKHVVLLRSINYFTTSKQNIERKLTEISMA